MLPKLLSQYRLTKRSGLACLTNSCTPCHSNFCITNRIYGNQTLRCRNFINVMAQRNQSSTPEWLVVIPDLPGSSEKRPLLAKKHQDDMRAERGSTWVLGGMMLESSWSDAGPGNNITGNVILAHAPSKEELLRMLMQDVYATDGVWDMKKVQITPFKSLFRSEL